jgi:ribosome biogenesis GTPase / thiamine phosphate phosphatase
LKKGLVIKSIGILYSVRGEDGKIHSCRIKGKYRLQDTKSTNPVVVGDWVDFEPALQNEEGMIINVYDRKNYIIRKSSNLSKLTNILAANIDQAFLIVTIAFPKTNSEFIDRYLATAEAYRIPVSILFNKIDIYTREHKNSLKSLKDIYEKIGYSCFEISVKENIKIDKIREILKDKICLFSGNSGVGKSSLINKLDDKIKVKTGIISGHHLKGKHTTSFAEMFELSTGGFVIDTPGIKGFGLIDFDYEEVYHFFPEFFKLSKDCQYYNCIHVHEPNCAVKKGISDNLISESRYKSYLSILEDSNNKHRMKLT